MGWEKGKPLPQDRVEKLKARFTPEALVEQGKRSRSVWADPVMRERILEARKSMYSAPGYRERKSAAIKAAWADPEKRKNMGRKSNIKKAVESAKRLNEKAIRLARGEG